MAKKTWMDWRKKEREKWMDGQTCRLMKILLSQAKKGSIFIHLFRIILRSNLNLFYVMIFLYQCNFYYTNATM